MDPFSGWIAIDPFMGRARTRAHPPPCAGPWEGRPSEGPLREGLAHGGGVGPGPGPAHEGIDSYSVQSGINCKGNIIDI